MSEFMFICSDGLQPVSPWHVAPSIARANHWVHEFLALMFKYVVWEILESSVKSTIKPIINNKSASNGFTTDLSEWGIINSQENSLGYLVYCQHLFCAPECSGEDCFRRVLPVHLTIHLTSIHLLVTAIYVWSGSQGEYPWQFAYPLKDTHY